MPKRHICGVCGGRYSVTLYSLPLKLPQRSFTQSRSWAGRLFHLSLNEPVNPEVSSMTQLCLISGRGVASGFPPKLSLHVAGTIRYLISSTSTETKEKQKWMTGADYKLTFWVQRAACWDSWMLVSKHLLLFECLWWRHWVFQGTFWVAHTAPGLKVVYKWAVVVISLKLKSGCPASACRASGKGKFGF